MGALGGPPLKKHLLTARRAGLIACPVCHLLCATASERPAKTPRCPRCGAALHSRKPDSIARTWALVIAACIFYIPANVLPMSTVTSLGMVQPDTIMSGVIYFVQSGSWPIALIIFIASIFVPLLKLFILSYLLISVQRRSHLRPKDRTGMLRGWDEGVEVPSLGIALYPEARGTGLARALMVFLHAAARVRGGGSC